jgi:hypothetical protein
LIFSHEETDQLVNPNCFFPGFSSQLAFKH